VTNHSLYFLDTFIQFYLPHIHPSRRIRGRRLAWIMGVFQGRETEHQLILPYNPYDTEVKEEMFCSYFNNNK